MDDSKYRNPFVGINPLLHEIFLLHSGWNGFYKIFLVECFKSLQKSFREMPYIAHLQENGFTYGRDDYKPLIALTIHELTNNQPIVWVEFVMPMYKIPNELFNSYCEQRQRITESGITFIELDFVHTHPPTFFYPDYSTSVDGAYPFHITIMRQTNFQVFHVDILESLPIITIPLFNVDTVTLDLDAIYQKLFAEFLYASEITRNYPQLTTYHTDDREKILAYLRQNGNVS
ncbi:MAG: DUF4058 family protein [Anaerolineae bacterium]|nr:DUF4058 family protein [Anaerolineae bacterium]